MPDFGQSFACVTDLRPNFGVVTGRRLLAEAVARRITTPRGQLIDDPDYGLDVREWLNDAMTPAQIQRLPALVDAELQKDERIVASTTEATFVNSTLHLTVTIDDGDGPFPLTIAVSALTVELLTVGR